MTLKKTPIILILVMLFLVMLINLSRLPIAWIDEIMLIDPAWNFIHYGKFIGLVWPHEGAENVFLAYLPLSSFIHIIELSIFPNELFYTRLLWYIMFILVCIYLYKYCIQKYMSIQSSVYILLCFFVLDEGINNALRSGRVEMPSMLLICAGMYYAIRNKYPSLQAFIISLLLIAHPNVYPIALVLSIYLLTKKAPWYKRVQYILSIASFPIIYLSLANFDCNAIYNQLILHGREHDSDAVDGNRFVQHFIGRFLPMYGWQFYMILLNIGIHIYCLYSIVFRWNPRNQQIEWAFLACSIFWFFTLAPFNRYSSILSLMIFMMVPGFLQRVLSIFGFLRISFRNLSKIQIAMIFALMMYVSLPFVSRHAVAMLQYESRDIDKVHAWLDTELKTDSSQNKVLIIDEAVGFYYMMKHEEKVDFTLPYALHKYKIEDYSKVYYLSFREAPTLSKKVATYELNEKSIALPIKQKIMTYNGLNLYEVPTQEALKELQR